MDIALYHIGTLHKSEYRIRFYRQNRKCKMQLKHKILLFAWALLPVFISSWLLLTHDSFRLVLVPFKPEDKPLALASGLLSLFLLVFLWVLAIFKSKISTIPLILLICSGFFILMGRFAAVLFLVFSHVIWVLARERVSITARTALMITSIMAFLFGFMLCTLLF